MTLIEKLSNLGGIVDRDEMAKACSEIPDEDLRLALMTLALTYNQNIKINEEFLNTIQIIFNFSVPRHLPTNGNIYT